MRASRILCELAPARADWQFAPFFGYAFNGETTLVTPEALGDIKVRWNVGGTVTLIGKGPLGVEGIVLLVPHFFEAGNVGDGLQQPHLLVDGQRRPGYASELE